MTMSITAFPGRYIQGPGVLRTASKEIRKYGKKALIIIDPFVADNIWPQYSQWFEDIEMETSIFGGECCEEEINRVIGKAVDCSSTNLVAMGGGKTVDTVKAAADQMGMAALIIPTAASSDAPCSAVAVVYTPEGEVQKVVKTRSNPSVVLMDTEIIVKAPVRLLTAGMGDALATWFEADSARQTNAPNVLGSCASRTAYHLARLCYETIADYGALAIEACEAGCINPALEYVVEANTLLSGIGFESGGLAAAHGIHNALSVLPRSHHALHGEKVAFGLLASLFLTGRRPQVIEETYKLFSLLRLPTTFAGLGMGDVAPEELLQVGEASCLPGNNIYHEPVTISPTSVRDALLMADYHGRSLK
jgi:Glycerol dehydrogenase and related enzymes